MDQKPGMSEPLASPDESAAFLQELWQGVALVCRDREAVVAARTDGDARERLVSRLREVVHSLLADPAGDADTADFLVEMHEWFTPWLSESWGKTTEEFLIGHVISTNLLREVGEMAWLGALSHGLHELGERGSNSLQEPSWDSVRSWIRDLETDCRADDSDPESDLLLTSDWLTAKAQAFPTGLIGELAVNPVVAPLLFILSSLASLFPPWAPTLKDRLTGTVGLMTPETLLFNRTLWKALGLKGAGGKADREMVRLLLQGERLVNRIVEEGSLRLAAEVVEPSEAAHMDFEFLPPFGQGSQGDFRLIRLDTQVLIRSDSRVVGARIDLRYDFDDPAAIIHEAEPKAVTEDVSVVTEQAGKEEVRTISGGARIGSSFYKMLNLGVSRSRRASTGKSVRRTRKVHRIKQSVFGCGVEWELTRTETFDVIGAHRLSVRALVPAGVTQVAVNGHVAIDVESGQSMEYSESHEMLIPE